MTTPLAELLERYHFYFKKAAEAHDRNDLAAARDYFCAAADKLLQCARLSDGDLRAARLGQAEDILDLVEQVDAQMSASPVPSDGGAEPPPAEFAISERPSVKLSDVAGLEQVKRAIKEKLIDPFLFPDLMKEFGLKAGGGILLYGPPGNGKTRIARAVAGELDAAFLPVLPNEILSKWVGDPEKNVHRLFREARRHPRSVIFFDEMDGLASSRDHSQDYMRRLVNQLLAEMQGFDQHKNPVLVIGATNNPDLLDRAMLRPGRFDELVYVPLPDGPARREIWKLHLKDTRREDGIDYDSLAAASDGFSGAEIADMCQRAARKAFNRRQSGETDACVRIEDLREVLDGASPRTSPADLRRLEAFSRAFDPASVTQPATNTETSQPAQAGTPRPSSFAVKPDGVELERLLDAMLSPFPIEGDIVPELARLLQGRSVADICDLVSRAVKSAYGGPDTPPDRRLALDDFIVPEPRNDVNVAGLSARVPDESASREVLAAGRGILERHKPDLSRPQYDALVARLYALADAANRSPTRATPPDVLAFEAEVALAVKASEGADTGQASPAPSRPAPAEDLDTDRRRALAALMRFHADLDADEYRGMVDRVRDSRDLDVDAFESEVRTLAEARRTGRLRARVEALIQDRRDFLTPEEMREIEARISSPEPDLDAIAADLEQRTYRRKFAAIVDSAMQGLVVGPRLKGRLRRRAIRRMEQSGEAPTPDSARTRLRGLHEELLALDRQEAAAGHWEPPTHIEDARHLLMPRPFRDFDDVAGMECLKRQMDLAVDVPLNPRRRAEYEKLVGDAPKNAAMLLYGAPGCGKTFLARAAAGEFAQRYGFTVYHVPVRSIREMHYTRKLSFIAQVFQLARAEGPAIVIWDEFDGIASPQKFSGRKYDDAVCTELKQQFEGVVASKQVVAHIATSNYPWVLEQALLREGRLGTLIHVLPPDYAARRELLDITLERSQARLDVDLDHLARVSAGMTTAELLAALRNAQKQVLERRWSGGQAGALAITTEDIVSAIQAGPRTGFRGWLAEARDDLSKPRFARQRPFFSNLINDVERFLDGDEAP